MCNNVVQHPNLLCYNIAVHDNDIVSTQHHKGRYHILDTLSMTSCIRMVQVLFNDDDIPFKSLKQMNSSKITKVTKAIFRHANLELGCLLNLISHSQALVLSCCVQCSDIFKLKSCMVESYVSQWCCN